MTMEIHNAKACTVDGRNCWITGLNPLRGLLGWASVSEHETLDEAETWAKSFLQERKIEAAIIITHNEGITR